MPDINKPLLSRFERAMIVSAFAGAGVGILAACYGLVFPHPASLFFSAAYKVTNIALSWAVISVFIFASAIMVRIAFYER